MQNMKYKVGQMVVVSGKNIRGKQQGKIISIEIPNWNHEEYRYKISIKWLHGGGCLHWAKEEDIALLQRKYERDYE